MSDKAKSESGALKLAIASAMGIAFGFALEKGRVFEPMVIRDQMLMSRFIMMKMFVSAIAAGQAGLVALRVLAPRAFERAALEYDSCVRSKTVAATALGGALLGAGMTLSGACPGMVAIQFGISVPNSYITLGGIFVGTYLFALSFPVIKKVFAVKTPADKLRLDQKLAVSYPALAGGLAVAMVGFVYVLESLVPYESELSFRNVAASSIFQLRAWPPYMTGMLVGLLQIPAVLFLGDTLGSASSYCTVSSQALAIPFLRKPLEYLNNYRTGTGNWWQVFYIASAMAGAAISSNLAASAAPPIAVSGVSAFHSFLGGILLIFGSRLAGGCTSGHGLSGIALLCNLSFVAVPAMFAGGMGLAFVMRAMGAM